MKATIIGGNGFIGQHLLQHLIKDGWTCWVPERNDPKLFREDLGYIFYCAGLTADYAERPFDTINAHVCLLNSILQNSQYQSLVYLSSTRLYDSANVSSGTEDASLTLNPNNARHLYDFSKALGESICLVAGKDRAKVARLSCVFNNDEDLDGFLPNLLREVLAKQAIKNETLQVESSLGYARDYVHLDDVISLLILIATEGKQQIYNIASGENVSNAELFSLLEELSGLKIVAKKNGFNTPPVISIEKIQEEFGWQPKTTLEKLKQLFLEKSLDKISK